MTANGHPLTPADLLGVKTEAVYGEEARILVEGQTVLVTGAGGSIGGELVHQLVELGAGHIVCVDRDEYALYSAQLSRTGAALMSESGVVLADVQDYTAMRQLMAETRPSIVFHAAAYKHVPTLERMPSAAMLTNTMGTHNVVRAAAENGVRRVVNISTDKAANPVNVLGMSKRLAEVVAASYADDSFRVTSVRFGNVLGSRGSFVETMVRQVAAGKPVTITDPDMTRYFMTIPQASGLVIEAAVLGGSGQTYVLNMGQPVRIIDLIQQYSQLSGFPYPEIIVTGMREGEKLHERLFDSSEVCMPTAHPDISSVKVAAAGPDFLDRLDVLYAQARGGMNATELRSEIAGTLAITDHATSVCTGV